MLAVFVTFALCPLLVVTMPGVAEAAATYGPVVHGAFSKSGNFSCAFDAYWVTPDPSNQFAASYVKVTNDVCADGVLTRYLDTDTAHSWQTLTFNGTAAADGSACSVSTGTMPAADAGGGSLAFSGTTGGGAGCSVTQVCWSMTWANVVWNDANASDCRPFALGAPPAAQSSPQASTCTYGTPTAVQWYDAGRTDGAYSRMTINFLGASPNHDAWTVSGIKPDATKTANKAPGYNRFFVMSTGATGYGGWTATNVWHYGADVRVDVIGAPGTGVTISANKDAGYLDQHIGYNDPANCVFYFGPTIWPDTTSPNAQPAAGLGAPAVAQPEPTPTATPPAAQPASSCTFKLSDASTWLDGGMCAAVGLLGAIFHTLGDMLQSLLGLPAKVASAILDGLGALFEPSDAAMRSFGDDLHHSWDDSNGGAWSTTVQNGVDAINPGGLAGSSSGTVTTFGARQSIAADDTISSNGNYQGCMGPAVHLGDLPVIGEATQRDWYPFQACDGAVADIAAKCHLILSVIIGFLGAFKILEMLVSAVGLSNQIRIMGGHDWSNDHTVMVRD